MRPPVWLWLFEESRLKKYKRRGSDEHEITKVLIDPKPLLLIEERWRWVCDLPSKTYDFQRHAARTWELTCVLGER